MSLKSFAVDGLVGKIITAVAGTAIIGGGTVVLRSAQTNAVQEREIAQLQQEQGRARDAVDRLTDSVQNLDKNVAVLNERLKNQ